MPAEPRPAAGGSPQAKGAMLLRVEAWTGRLLLLITALGALAVLVQAIWITYGVFVRYVLRQPDRLVTEATALLLLPVAFAGMAYALREDAFPKVTMVVEILPRRARSLIATLNLALMLAIGVFLTIVTASAAIRTFHSGASTEVLRWPEFIFWVPVAVSIAVFDLYALTRLLGRLFGIRQVDKESEWSGT